MRKELEPIFAPIHKRVTAKFPKLENVFIAYCKTVDKEHKKNQRQYAHTLHYFQRGNGYIICVSMAMRFLPERKIKGLIWHEFGHLVDYIKHGKVDSSFPDGTADLLVSDHFGVKIKYGKDRVQYV